MNKNFTIPQVTEEKEEKINNQESIRKNDSFKRDPFVSPYFGKNNKDNISAVCASYGNQGAQYDIFRKEEDRVRPNSDDDYVTYVDDRVVSSRRDLTEEERRTPSYLQQDPAYADMYNRQRNIDRNVEGVEVVNIPNSREEIVKSLADDLASLANMEEDNYDNYDSYEETLYNPTPRYEEPTPKYEEPSPSAPTPSYVNRQVERDIPRPQPQRKSRMKYVAPPLSILHKGLKGASNLDSTLMQKEAIEQTLRDFNINGHVAHYIKGPSVTQFEIEVAPGVRLENVANIKNNIMGACRAKTIRVQCPIPGKPTVGIEIPNADKDEVCFGDLLTPQFLKDGKPLNAVIGLDLEGKPVYFDIDKAPHALIAGTTGSGKSVCSNCIINSILYKYHPDDVKLILVDPKVIEYGVYQDIPHLAMPVITEPKEAQAALKWLCEEMDNRYRMMNPFHVHELDKYNQIALTRAELPHLPYFVVIIDELADLVSTSGNETLNYIQRLTQKGRAAGIHLILATQRPSTDIINGTIKSTTPVRIAFQVRSYVDSGIILDHKGAEALLGKGDMLFNDSVNEYRAQGALITDEEIVEIVNCISPYSHHDYVVDLQEKVEQQFSGGEGMAIEPSEVKAIARFVVQNNNASINSIQKTFNCGFNKAQNVMNILQDWGIVSENLGSRARIVQVTPSELESILADK